MDFSLQEIKDATENSNKLVSVTNQIPKFLSQAIEWESGDQETTKKVVTTAIIHEGLESENLEDRIEHYEGNL